MALESEDCELVTLDVVPQLMALYRHAEEWADLPEVETGVIAWVLALPSGRTVITPNGNDYPFVKCDAIRGAVRFADASAADLVRIEGAEDSHS